MFRREWLRRLPAPLAGPARRVWGWDLAATRGAGSWTVGVKMAMYPDGRVVIEDVRRGRWSPAEVNAAILDAAAEGHPMSVPQDPGQAGVAQKAQILGLAAGRLVYFSPERGSKEDRARPLAAHAEGGMVYLVEAPWCDAFVSEAEQFPASDHKDQVDAASRAFSFLLERRPPLVGAGPRTIG